jgi:hypothetical protein
MTEGRTGKKDRQEKKKLPVNICWEQSGRVSAMRAVALMVLMTKDSSECCVGGSGVSGSSVSVGGRRRELVMANVVVAIVWQ